MLRADSVADLLRERVEAEPDRRLLVFEGAETSRVALFDRACRAANLPGVVPGRHVGVLSDNVPDSLALFLGCALRGAVFVGLDPQRKGPDLADDLHAAGVELLVVEPKHAPLLDDETLEAFVTRERFLVIDREAPPGLLEPSESLEAALAVSSPADPEVVPEPGQTLAVTLAPGDRARPVRWTHADALGLAGEVLSDVTLTGDDVCWSGVGVRRPAGFGWGLMPVLLSGGWMVAARQPSASQLVRETRAHGCTWLVYEGNLLADAVAIDGSGSLGAAIGTGSDPASAASFVEAFGCAVLERPQLDG